MEEESTGWAVPGTAVDQPAPPAPGGAPGAGLVAGAAAVPAVVLRPMTAADILDGGFAVVKARPRRILGLAAAFVVPAELAVALVRQDALRGSGLVELFSADPTLTREPATGGELAAQWAAWAFATVVPAMALVCLAAAVGHLVSQWIMGRDAPAGEMAGAVGRSWWPLLASFVVVKLAEAASVLLCFAGLVFVMPLFVVVAPVVGVERVGGMEAIRRSLRLVRGRYFPVMGVALLMALVSTLLGEALAALPQALVAWDGHWWPLLALGAAAGSIVVVPFVAAATVLLYLDLRVRTEGLDLEMAAARALDHAG